MGDRPRILSTTDLEAIVVDHLNPKKSPWGDLTDEWNSDGIAAVEKGWITRDGGLTFRGQKALNELHSRPKTTEEPPKDEAKERTAEKAENIALDRARKKLLALLEKKGFTLSLRINAEGGRYKLEIFSPKGGRRKELVRTFKGDTPLKCVEKAYDEYEQSV